MLLSQVLHIYTCFIGASMTSFWIQNFVTHFFGGESITYALTMYTGDPGPALTDYLQSAYQSKFDPTFKYHSFFGGYNIPPGRVVLGVDVPYYAAVILCCTSYLLEVAEVFNR